MSWRRLWQMVGPSFKGTRRHYALALFLILISAGAQAFEPLIYGRIVDTLIGVVNTDLDNVFTLLLPLIGLWGLAALIASLAKEVSQNRSWKGGYGVLRNFAHQSLKTVLGWDPEHFSRLSLGATAKRIDKAWDASWTMSSRMLTDIVPTVVAFLAFVVVGLTVDWRMMLVTMSAVPVLCTLTLIAYRQADERQEQLNEAWEEASHKLSEAVQAVMPIKAYVAETAILADHDAHMQVVMRKQARLNWIWTLLEIGNGLVRSGARIVVVLAGLWFISRGTLSVGQLVTFLGMVGYILAPFDYLLADVLRRVSEIRSAFGRLSGDWFEANKLIDKPNAKRLREVAGELVFENISVRYGGPTGREAISDLSLHVRAGSSLAIVGPSGSGKSTFVKLINRFLDPSAGQVLLDGRDIRDVRVSDLRRAVGVVQQETVLFNDTIYNNVKFAKPSATRAQILAACKKAQAHEFILRLKDKYETLVGERGARLSGGERQRIALARIFLANPPILILDESTSALDSETEHKLQIALQSAMQSRTTIIIAHRLSTVYMADQIAVIEKGKLVELGSHQDLIREGGMYERLWRLQSGGYLPD